MVIRSHAIRHHHNPHPLKIHLPLGREGARRGTVLSLLVAFLVPDSGGKKKGRRRGRRRRSRQAELENGQEVWKDYDNGGVTYQARKKVGLGDAWVLLCTMDSA